MPFTQVDATKKFRLGTRKTSVDGNQYVYLKGVTSCADGSWVVFDNTYTAILAVADIQGPVAIAQAAVDAATKYGWFLIYGADTALVLASFDGTNGAGVWLTSTAGSVDDSDVAGDAVHNVTAFTDRDTTTGMSAFFVSYPYVTDYATD